MLTLLSNLKSFYSLTFLLICQSLPLFAGDDEKLEALNFYLEDRLAMNSVLPNEDLASTLVQGLHQLREWFSSVDRDQGLTQSERETLDQVLSKLSQIQSSDRSSEVVTKTLQKFRSLHSADDSHECIKYFIRSEDLWAASQVFSSQDLWKEISSHLNDQDIAVNQRVSKKWDQFGEAWSQQFLPTESIEAKLGYKQALPQDYALVIWLIRFASFELSLHGYRWSHRHWIDNREKVLELVTPRSIPYRIINDLLDPKFINSLGRFDFPRNHMNGDNSPLIRTLDQCIAMKHPYVTQVVAWLGCELNFNFPSYIIALENLIKDPHHGGYDSRSSKRVPNFIPNAWTQIKWRETLKKRFDKLQFEEKKAHLSRLTNLPLDSIERMMQVSEKFEEMGKQEEALQILRSGKSKIERKAC